jgi:hypothetical protein
MNVFRWDNAKNQWLIEHRGVCFEQVVILIESGTVIDVIEHPNQGRYPGQKLAIVEIGGYAYLVPYVEDKEGFFLKTIIPSRKMTAKYLGGSHEEGES